MDAARKNSNIGGEVRLAADRRKLHERFLFRGILPGETEQAVKIEQICFPPNEACTPEMMRERIEAVPLLFLVAVDRASGLLAGFLNGISTNERTFRDEFFTDSALYEPDGRHVMLLGLDVLPAYRGLGLARALVDTYCAREKEAGRISVILTCHDEKISMYERMGFSLIGASASVWGGERWNDMERLL